MLKTKFKKNKYSWFILPISHLTAWSELFILFLWIDISLHVNCTLRFFILIYLGPYLSIVKWKIVSNYKQKKLISIPPDASKRAPILESSNIWKLANECNRNTYSIQCAFIDSDMKNTAGKSVVFTFSSS